MGLISLMRDRLLQLLNETHGASGAAVVNSDGVVVMVETAELQAEPGSGISEYGMVIDQLNAVGSVFALGEPVDLRVDTEDRVTLMRRLNEHYFVVLWLSGSKISPRASFNLRLAATDLQFAI